MEEQNEELENVVEAEFEEVESLSFATEEEEGQVLGVEDNYDDVEKDVVYVDPDTGETIDPNNLSPFGKIKFIANQLGQVLDEPAKNCKHCYGRGYTSIDAKTQLPTPCSCVYKTYRATNPSWQQVSTPRKNRKESRLHEKRIGKLINSIKPEYERKEAIKEKSKAGLGKYTPGYVAKEFRVDNVENVTIENEEKEPIQIETAEGVIGKGE